MTLWDDVNNHPDCVLVVVGLGILLFFLVLHVMEREMKKDLERLKEFDDDDPRTRRKD